MIVLTVSSPPLLAEDEARQDVADQLFSVSEALDEVADKNDSELSRIEQELVHVEALLKDKNANIDDLVTQATVLQEKITLMKTKQSEIDSKFDEINRNYEKYVFQTRAKAIVPFLYAAIGFSMADGDEKLIYSLAGYGTGALVENTGYGLASGITWLTYSFEF